MTKIPVITSYTKGQRLEWFIKRRETTKKIEQLLNGNQTEGD